MDTQFFRYEWDPRKDRANRRKHYLSLADGIPALEDPEAECWVDNRYDYPEERVVTLGSTEHGILLVVTIEASQDRTRILSVRKAQRYEKDWYYHGRP